MRQFRISFRRQELAESSRRKRIPTSQRPDVFPNARKHTTTAIKHAPPSAPSFANTVTMGIWDTFSDIVEAVTPWSVVEAEAPAETQQVRCTTIFLFSRRGPACG